MFGHIIVCYSKKKGECLGLSRRLVWELIGVSVGYLFCGFVIGLLALRGSLGDSISHHL